MRVLFVGDMHLGRRLPSSILTFAEGEALDPLALLPEAAFDAMVDFAIGKQVKAVFFAGDLVERMEDRFYAFPILEGGVRRLMNEGIETFAICGNHDVEALPRLAKRIDGFRILGAGGRWESVEVAEGDLKLRVTGWSFPTKVVRENPLVGFPRESCPDRGAWVGILHGDLDGRDSKYAPVSRAELEGLPLHAWFLGHVHKPEGIQGERFVGYLGSLQGLDPGEPGLHGPLLVDLEEGDKLQLQRVSVAPLAFVRSEMEWNATEGGLEDQLDLLHQAITAKLGVLAAEWDVRVLGVRLVLRGRVRNLGEIRKFLADRVQAQEFRAELSGTKVFVEKVVDNLRPTRDLSDLVRGGGPLGRLVEKLLILEAGGESSKVLVKELAKELEAIKGLDVSAWPEDRVREQALSAGLGVLDALLEEIEGGL
jgi:DNA repair exonuclease SbcCD nuclease subunit